MAILQECPICNNKQSLKRKKCSCGADLDKFKRSGKIKYHIQYRLPGGKQRKELVGYSIEDAKAADGKRKVQKKEGRIFDMLPQEKSTFKELSDWYLGLPKIKKLASYQVLCINLASFNAVFGHKLATDLKQADIEDYQVARLDQGLSKCYVDQEISVAKRVVSKAWENDKVSGDALKPFKRTKKLLKKGANKRKRVLTIEEYTKLSEALPTHAKNIFITGFFTGMRMGEILSLKWEQIDFKNRRIELEKDQTKDDEERFIPISDTLLNIFQSISKNIHDDHVFLYRGKPLKSIRDSLRRTCQKIGIPYGRNVKNGITPHDLRHTFNTYMRKSGAHDTVTMDITGHATREMFDWYNTVDDSEKAEAVKQLEDFISDQKNSR